MDERDGRWRRGRARGSVDASSVGGVRFPHSAKVRPLTSLGLQICLPAAPWLGRGRRAFLLQPVLGRTQPGIPQGVQVVSRRHFGGRDGFGQDDRESIACTAYLGCSPCFLCRWSLLCEPASFPPAISRLTTDSSESTPTLPSLPLLPPLPDPATTPAPLPTLKAASSTCIPKAPTTTTSPTSPLPSSPPPARSFPAQSRPNRSSAATTTSSSSSSRTSRRASSRPAYRERRSSSRR